MALRLEVTTVLAASAIAGALAGCGGGGAKSPGTCPEGTELKGSDCVPEDSASSGGDDSSSGSSGSASSSSSSSKGGGDGSSGGSSSAGSSSDGASAGGGAGGGGGSTPYDKDAVEVQLKRGARQVKSGCGSATDDEGHATGPWGQTKASIVLGRNGHVKQVTVPAPYDGKPVGVCILHAFQKIQFPPYAGSSDVVVDWDIELVQPK
jgi:hypothetical protein